MWPAWQIRIEWRLLPLLNNIAFKLSLGEFMNNFHLVRSWFKFKHFIKSLTLQQTKPTTNFYSPPQKKKSDPSDDLCTLNHWNSVAEILPFFFFLTSQYAASASAWLNQCGQNIFLKTQIPGMWKACYFKLFQSNSVWVEKELIN